MQAMNEENVAIVKEQAVIRKQLNIKKENLEEFTNKIAREEQA